LLLSYTPGPSGKISFFTCFAFADWVRLKLQLL
jgi:hypothetical protein